MRKLLFKTIPLTILVAIQSVHLNAQDTEVNGWFFLSHVQKINDKWSYMTDVQLRSSSKFEYLQNVLLRPGLLYKLTDQQSVGAGYTYFATWEQTEAGKAFVPENRIFEQYTLELKKGRLKINNRFRLEQRFIQKTDGDVFAQRFRYQFQARFRLTADSEFKNGLYVNIQNEIFLNVQNQNTINNHFFDQNRPYLGMGYRINEKIEIEFGYYHRYQIKEDSRLKENILQLMMISNL